jgi:hypothetical protein
MTDPVDFIPAGCCCEQESKAWLGRRARGQQPYGSFPLMPPAAPPQPIFGEGRAPIDRRPQLILIGVVLCALGLAVAWAVVNFTKV